MRHVVWFRGRDLRLADQPALHWAVSRGEVIPVAFLPPPTEAPFQRTLMLQALSRLDRELREAGSRLVLLEGSPQQVLPERLRAWEAQGIAWMRRVEPTWREGDAHLTQVLVSQEFAVQTFDGDGLLPPGGLRNGSGHPYRVFTPFARAFRSQIEVPRPLPAPTVLPPVPFADGVARGLPDPGPTPKARLAAFLEDRLADYPRHRDRLDFAEGTSRLGPDLRLGALSIREAWHGAGDAPAPAAAIASFQNELLWREFALQTLWDQPDLVHRPFRPAWEGFPWREDEAALEAWKEGRTGIPLVDAAARELLSTGHVHNRARMIAACFLTKHLLIDWRRGEAHYRTWLADGCQAANVLNWQWSAGCGVDAQPWFRVFNPGNQGEKFDPDGAYVRRWVPELADVPVRHLANPHAWGRPLDYPRPLIDPAMGRVRFLAEAKGYLGGADATGD